jgi:hypothetical protein
LKKPDSKIVPIRYRSVFALIQSARLRAGYEAAKFGNKNSLWPILEVTYKEMLANLLSVNNFRMSCIFVAEGNNF